ncbi:MAG: hypothetical protein ACJ763_19270 [Bdellovibrionia bacterium]
MKVLQLNASTEVDLTSFQKLESNDLYQRVLSKRHDPVLARVQGKDGKLTYLLGQVSENRDLPDYPLIVLSDAKKRSHLIDPEQPNVEFYAWEGELSPETQERLLQSTPGSSKNVVDLSRLKQSVCPKFRAMRSNPLFKEVMKKLRRENVKTVKRKFLRLSTRYVAGCALPSFLVTEFIEPLDALTEYRHNREPDGTLRYWIAEHNSNFMMGLYAMATFDQCLKTLAPGQAANILKAALGIDFLMNVHYEVYMGLDHAVTGDRIRTDWQDLSTGVAGIITYAYFAKAFDRMMGIDFVEACK